jgi:hypothetical protein
MPNLDGAAAEPMTSPAAYITDPLTGFVAAGKEMDPPVAIDGFFSDDHMLRLLRMPNLDGAAAEPMTGEGERQRRSQTLRDRHCNLRATSRTFRRGNPNLLLLRPSSAFSTTSTCFGTRHRRLTLASSRMDSPESDASGQTL